MRLYWTFNARRHLQAIHDYIAQNSRRYARRMVARIIRRAEHLIRFPHSGSVVPEYEADDIREVIETPYRIIYRVTTDWVDVLAVVHAARQLPRTI